MEAELHGIVQFFQDLGGEFVVVVELQQKLIGQFFFGVIVIHTFGQYQ